MSDQADYAAFQEWKKNNQTPEAPAEKTSTEHLKEWFEGIARHLSHPVPEKVLADLDAQIEDEKGSKATDSVEEIPAEEVETSDNTPKFSTQ